MRVNAYTVIIAVLALAVRAFLAQIWPNMVADAWTLLSIAIMVWIDDHT